MSKNTQDNNKITNLDSALKDCHTTAKEGYKIAKNNLKETEKAINDVADSLSSTLNFFNDGSVRSPGVVDDLKSQLQEVMNDLESLQKTTVQKLEDRKKRLRQFSITLFGRTMAGKSTLMEILTQGDGSSIGKGAQRTTRDVRTYSWNGLEVTDVPGVAAFEGAKDEEIAFQAAAQADLVIFLITDDAPQPVEAECLARIRSLGKPVLGICNVKIALKDKEDIILFLRKKEKQFDKIRIKEILDQFSLLTSNYLPGKRVQFVITHLHSKFLSLLPAYKQQKEKLEKSSSFYKVENRIINEILGKGTFFRIKSFVDGAVHPMMLLTNQLLEYSGNNSTSGRVLIDKRRQTKEWLEQFKEDGIKKIDTTIDKLMNELRTEVPDFCEDHYEDKNAGDKWNSLVKSMNIEQKLEKLQKNLLDKCKKALNEIARELKSELALIAGISGDSYIKTEKVRNYKKGLNWGTITVGGGLGVASIIISSIPLVVATGVVGLAGLLISFFFDDHENKVNTAREKLSKSLNRDINKIENSLRKGLKNWFYKELLNKQIYVLINDLNAVTTALFDLSDTQRKLAWTLNARQKELNKKLVNSILTQFNSEDLIIFIVDVARIPGFATMILIEKGAKIPEGIRKKMEELLNENIWFVHNTNNQFSILSQAIGKGCDRNLISIEEKIQVAHIPYDNLDERTKSRVPLAQQLTSLHIMAKKNGDAKYD